MIGIGFFLGHQRVEDYKTNSDAKIFLEDFDKKIAEKTNIEVKQEDIIIGNEEFGLNYKGYNVSGKLEIPKTGVKYPILSEMTDSRALELSVCIQYFSERCKFKLSGKYSYYRA